MSWPTPQEYNEAIQDPALCFSDPELRAGTPDLTPLGLPRAYSGSFASVYRMRCGSREWAVRCFLREYADQQERYSAISGHLARAKLPYTVGFEFILKGIRVAGHWYPILKMEWIRGDSLMTYIQKNLSNEAALRTLADNWLRMTAALARASVAHGDLQHGNVLISGNEIKLIDYDGMFVPALSGRVSHEVGHRNYQHPRRIYSDFGPHLDNFSAWVIYLSLVALVTLPGLRSQFRLENEYILLRREDFEQPDRSSVLTHLLSHRDPGVRLLASSFRSLLAQDLPHIPGIDGLGGTGKRDAKKSGKPADFRQPEETAEEEVAVPSVSWITEMVFQQPKPVRAFNGSIPVTRVLVLLAFALTAPLLALDASPVARYVIEPLARTLLERLGVATAYGATRVLEIALAVILGDLTASCVCYVRYANAKVVQEKRQAMAALREARARKRRVERALREIVRGRRLAVARFDVARRNLEGKRAEIQRREKQGEEAIQRELKRNMQPLEKHESDLLNRQYRELQAIQRQLGERVNALNGELARLSQAQAVEVAQTLRDVQKQFVDNFLRNWSVAHAPLPGTQYRGWSRERLIDLLMSNGIRSAYDVSYHRVDAVYGFGPVRTQALVNWRYQLEQQARAQMPQSLDPDTYQTIIAKYSARRQHLERDRNEAQQRLTAEESGIRVRYESDLCKLADEKAKLHERANHSSQALSTQQARECAEIDRAAEGLKRDHDKVISNIDADLAVQRSRLLDAEWAIEKARHDLTAFRAINFATYIANVI